MEAPNIGRGNWKKLGHKVRLLQARFVKAFVMGNKNDVMDARAIWMAVQQPSKDIAVKTEEKQSVLVLHPSWTHTTGASLR